jgi:MATE family multidrug resistance protein
MFFSPWLARLTVLAAELRPARRWNAPQGYRELLALCLPLIASTTASSLMLFTDRIFLSRYSSNAIAASLPAGIAKIAVTSIFLGIASYTGVFVAQYVGAGKPGRAAAALWQGLYFSLACGLALALLWFAAPWLFSFGSSSPEIVKLELQYFGVLVVCSPLDLALMTMSSFMAALGRTKAVMWVSLAGALFNIPTNYLFIFGLEIGGHTVVPEMGVLGAALATTVSWLLSDVIFCLMIFNRRMERSHQIRSNRALDWRLMLRLLKFGWPGGLQFFMEVFAFGFFSFAVANLDDLVLACNNIVFSMEALSFFPMIGVGQAVSIVVGQAIGRGRPEEGARACLSGAALSTIYVCGMGLAFLTLHRPLLSLFIADGLDTGTVDYMLSLGKSLLRFVAAYSFFDGLYLCCFGAIKGAGDVWFPMVAMAAWGLLGLVAPILILFSLGWATIFTMWICMVFYVIGLTATGIGRYMGGKWKGMQVIEAVAIAD